ncbi:hypothetical protein C3Y87_02965 [Carbonactinospora thermoautotrophica]|uniref:YCII-related protein n=1 Tax=Carbonactinospora thermoautotrophica TaxID=1469144 RepID=A0A132N0N6_9ACTN|nr:YciI family protein [Carbonactinospora thermoautotrophica]KWX02536.1 YCII-related protein [Carbonactinospora thermoautotrophica]KWX03634.1 hypothetical protein TH66_12415 [Carbonactinospora thermoautotrophica]MCX9190393.1 hypothetical protein [Carbonactinospora thermoautotrophica]
MAKYVAQLEFTDPARRLEVRSAHREYCRELFARGSLVMAGPWADETGALLVYEAADEAAARELLAKDPYTLADVYRLVLFREWRQVLP